MKNIRERLSKPIGGCVLKYSSSLPFDCRLLSEDITGSIVHVQALQKCGIISAQEANILSSGLDKIQSEMESGKFNFSDDSEDIHMAIEKRLFEIVGDTAGKLHTARSRNDQIVLDLRMYLKKVIYLTFERIGELESALLDIANNNFKIIIPGYTHLQPAQPVLLAHHLLAYFEMLERDKNRFSDAFKRVDILPLGSGALAGVAYPLDREMIARELGFHAISQNSIDAVADRDFIIEFEAAASIAMMHISRLAEELILWSSPAFGFIEIDDEYATTSSIMPQKKNPDVAELARGKTGRIYGHLQAILTMMKGLPLAYNRDLQEDKEGLFDTVDTLIPTLEIMTGMVKSLSFNEEAISKALGSGYILATDIADYLVRKGESFRNSHMLVGRLVNYAIERKKELNELELKDYQKFSPLFENDILKTDMISSITSRNQIGGTSPQQVEEALRKARNKLKSRGIKSIR
jgi:argininosuccinate lyase